MTHRTVSRRRVLLGSAALAAVRVSGLNAETPPTVHEVDIRAFAFEPATVRVRVGDTVRWTNRDLAPHTATATPSGWDTQTLERNASAEIRVTAGMTTSYVCAFHPHMRGTLEIVP
ncbi:MAG: plastocyanin/azurin family copper-binding protein [Pseudomonadota bacterium]